MSCCDGPCGACSVDDVPGTQEGHVDHVDHVDVLLLEDDADVAVTTVAVLERAGLTVRAAPTVREALALCRTLVFDAFVLDHSMDEPNSESFLEQAPDEGIAVIVSASNRDVLDDIQRRRPERVFAVRSKPLDPSELLDLVTATIGESRHRRGRPIA